MTTMDADSAAIALLSDRAVQAYFLILGVAVHRCIKLYYHKPSSTTSSSTSTTSTSTSTSTSSSKPSILPLLLSAAIISITWYLILRFILTNVHTSASYFDDAYKDVLKTTGHYFTSTQLLTWAIVAVAWVATTMTAKGGDNGSGGDVAFLFFGFLGAMGAAFALWVPTLYRENESKDGGGGGNKRKSNDKRRYGGEWIPVTYAVTSVIAFASILQLAPCDSSSSGEQCTPDEGFGTFRAHFRPWLQCLHVILIAPILLSFLLPSKRVPNVPSSILFGAMSVGIGSWHAHQISVVGGGAAYTVPMTDCQISITTDLVCCSCITLYAIYNDSLLATAKAKKATTHGMTSALARTCVAAVAMPLFSPAAVLAAHLCIARFGETYASFISYLQQRVASKLRQNDDASNSNESGSSITNSSATGWCNLGLRTEENSSYDEACENLARALGKIAQLSPADGVLCCGCGSPDEARYFKRTFDLRHATGIDPTLEEGRRSDDADWNVRTVRAAVEDLGASLSDGEKGPLFPPRFFDKILALDAVYHYADKEAFFRDCFAMLPDKGRVGVSDIVLKKHGDDTPFWVKAALRMMGVSTDGLWSVEQYKHKLAAVGYDANDIKVELVGDAVFKGWTNFLPQCLLRHIDYALISAAKPAIAANDSPTEKKKKKRIAIIGSGLAGLSSAHRLLTSARAADYEVDMYEANDRPGLAGNTTLIQDQLVDVPARMACLGYYNRYKLLLEELDISSTVVRTDSSFYGDDGHGEQVCHCYDQNSLVNLYNAVFVGGLGKLWRMVRALSTLSCEIDGDGSTNSGDEHSITFGEWLQLNLDVSDDATYKCRTTNTTKQHDLPSLTSHSNPFIYIMVGSLSWMLSCTWADLMSYPADIVLPYCRGLRMDKLGVGRDGQVIRIVPSIKVLEGALLYGVRKLHLNSRVATIDGKNKVVNGVSYDVVIVATESKAVPKVLSNCSPVFNEIAYHPSTIYIHTDKTFMPPNKKDWKCWNVEMSSGRKEPQLTFWLNEFYPDAKFEGNVFQTWAPVRKPAEGTILKRSDFERVVHSKETRSYVAEIEKEQGKDGIYYAGSYAVYGMGLLEQALISGEEAAKKVIGDLNDNVVASAKAPPAPLKALVIGAGASGLVTAKYLLESTNPIYDVTIVESSPDMGGSFKNKVYDNCRLVSSKYLTAFSDHRMSEDAELCPDHPSTAQYVEYLESYADRFGLRKLIKFESNVVSIKDADVGVAKDGDDSGGYDVQYQKANGQTIVTEHYDAVAVCSGLHNTPYIPNMFASSPSNGKSIFAKKFKGQIIHSSQYKESSLFANKRVLILGCGETAMDIAHRAITNPLSESVALSVRRGFLSIPHNLAEDRPLDVFITNLFEHSYEHPWVHALRLRWVLSTVFIRLFLFLTGSSLGFNQWAVPTSPMKRGYHIINKSHAAMGHLNVPIKKLSLWGRFWMWAYGENGLRPIESFHLTQVTDVEEDGVTVRFGDGRTYEADLIVLATGYKQSFPFLDSKIQEEFREESLRSNADGKGSVEDMSKYNLKEDYLPSEHFIVGTTRPRLGFIGFVRPNVGAIPPMSELQVMWWLEKMQGRVKMLATKPGPPSYMVLGQKYSYGVDYGNYMHRVAEDFDSAPTLSTLAKSSHPFRALYTYCIGQSMVSLFRLQGPYESKVCWEVVTGELWRVCIRRGTAENCGLLFMTWLSLLMNLIACVLECLWCLFTLRRPKFFVRY